MKIFNSIYKLVIIVFLVLLAFCLGLICKNKTFCGFSLAIVVGNSMYPNLKDGDFLVINQKAEYKINDIICFYNEDNKIVVHRIIDINENEILTKGDFNKMNDKPIANKQIIGKVVYKSTFLGIVLRNLHIIIIGFIVFCFLKLKNLDKYDKMYI